MRYDLIDEIVAIVVTVFISTCSFYGYYFLVPSSNFVSQLLTITGGVLVALANSIGIYFWFNSTEGLSKAIGVDNQ